MTIVLRTTLLALLALAVLACTAKKAASSQTDASDPPSAASAPADASWSATVDGVAVTGKGVEPNMQLINAAFVLPRQGPGEKKLVFTLNNTKNASDNTFDISVAFHVPPHPGTYTGDYQSCKCSMLLAKNPKGGPFTQYGSDSVM
ncbi:MAG: hypothetical protein ACREND_14140, partial [Gemmatimonadaceae bacterium]